MVRWGLFRCRWSSELIIYIHSKGEPYIYNVLDWSNPRAAGITAVMTIVLALVVQIFLLIVYWLRTFIYCKYFYKEDLLPTTGSMQRAATPTHISMVFHGHDNRVFSNNDEIAKN